MNIPTLFEGVDIQPFVKINLIPKKRKRRNLKQIMDALPLTLASRSVTCLDKFKSTFVQEYDQLIMLVLNACVLFFNFFFLPRLLQSPY